MALKFFYDAENSATLSGTDYSSGDTTGTNTAATFSGTAAKSGSYGIESAASTATNILFNAASIWPSAATPSASAGSMGLWFQMTTGSMGNALAFGIRCSGSSTSDRIGFEGLTGAKASIVCGNATNVQRTSLAGALSAATWYFLVGRWDIANGKLAIEIYTDAGGSTTLVEAVEDTGLALSSTYLPASAFANLQTALHSASEADPMYSDHFLISDSYSAPLQNNAFITDYVNYSESATSWQQFYRRPNTLLRM